MIEQEIQVDTSTALNRYPNVFLAAAQASKALYGARPVKVLSFGCSTGEELQSLRARFPGAALFGCDIKPEMVEAARAKLDGDATVFLSTPENLAAHGPFDVIFAMSVFCVHGPNAKEILDVYPFARFEESVGELAAHGSADFIYVLNNTSYFFQQTALFAADFAEIRHPDVYENSFVSRYDRSQARVAVRRVVDGVGCYQLMAPIGALPDSYFVTCLFARSPLNAGRTLEFRRPAPRDLSDVPITNLHVRGEVAVEDGGYVFPTVFEDRLYSHEGRPWGQRTLSRRSVASADETYIHTVYDFDVASPYRAPVLTVG